jgi:hypothetical protein
MFNSKTAELHPPLVVDSSTKKLKRVVCSEGKFKSNYSIANPSPIGREGRGKVVETKLSHKVRKLCVCVCVRFVCDFLLQTKMLS